MRIPRPFAVGCGAALLLAWLASAASTGPDDRLPAPPAAPPALDARDRVAADVQMQTARLRERLLIVAAVPLAARNPFEFGSSAQGDAARIPVAVPVPEAAPAAVPPRPAISLVAIAADDANGTARTAMISVGGQLLFGVAGDTLAGRLRVSAVGADAVELQDLVEGGIVRLSLR
jgi:hypothetical protein